MSADRLTEHFAKFFFLLGTMLIAMTLYYGTESIIVSRPVLVPINPPFKIVSGYEVVSPGSVVQYEVHYFKRLDIPGELSKQLIITNKLTGKKYQFVLASRIGHLPVGDIKRIGCARIPDYAPEGEAVIKLSSSHYAGRTRQFSVAYTEPFEVRK